MSLFARDASSVPSGAATEFVWNVFPKELQTYMKRTILSRALLLPALLLPIAAPVAHADDASKRTKIIELLSVLKVDQVGKQIIDGASTQTEQLGHREFGNTETPEQQKKVADLHQQVVTLITPAVEWKALQPEFVSTYAASYSEPEIDGILAFYKSPSGQALLNKGPEIGQKSSAIVQQHMAAVQGQLRDIVQNFAKSSAPAGSSPSGASPSSTAPGRPAPSLASPSSTPTQK